MDSVGVLLRQGSAPHAEPTFVLTMAGGCKAQTPFLAPMSRYSLSGPASVRSGNSNRGEPAPPSPRRALVLPFTSETCQK